MDYEVEICSLSSNFISNYPHNQYPELMNKLGRPYCCLLIDTYCDYFICVPYRSSILHNNAFLFKSTQRSRKTKSGLDYSKIVMIKESSYINSSDKAIIDQDEYNETMTNLNTIVREAVAYVDSYISHVNGSKILHKREFERKYKFSTLPYFHEIIGL